MNSCIGPIAHGHLFAGLPEEAKGRPDKKTQHSATSRVLLSFSLFAFSSHNCPIGTRARWKMMMKRGPLGELSTLMLPVERCCSCRTETAREGLQREREEREERGRKRQRKEGASDRRERPGETEEKNSRGRPPPPPPLALTPLRASVQEREI